MSRKKPKGRPARPKNANGRAVEAVQAQTKAPNVGPATALAESPWSGGWMAISGVSALAIILWAYWPTLASMVGEWRRQPDYSHGFLVPPIALFFLWSRRRAFPAGQMRTCIWGMALLLAATAGRVLAGRYYLEPLDGWTFPIAVAGAVWMLYGTAFLKWSWPAIVFLWFMTPIPYSAERWLSVPLQTVVTQLSTASLVMLGQGAISEGNVILLGDNSLFVDEACSGLRIFVGIFALAFAFVLFSRWSWWQKLMVLLAALPVAIVANFSRIVVTGLLYQWVSGEAGRKFSHDVAGFVMIPLAAALLWLFLIYLDRLFPQMEEVRRTREIYQAAQLSSE